METAYRKRDGRTGGRYQLRHAAGLYWLIDMEPPEGVYPTPVPLNEVGAGLWRAIDGGASFQALCEQLCADYEIPMEQAQEDARAFIEQLQALRVDLGGLK